MKSPPFNATLPPDTEGATTATALIDAFYRERRKPFEKLTTDALAGLLVLNEGSPLNAALRVGATPEGHYLRRALPSIRSAEHWITLPEPVLPDTNPTTPMECPA